jgi:caa(3)-type oxidase subunit IV
MAEGKAAGPGTATIDPHLEEAAGRWKIYTTVFFLLFALTIIELYTNRIVADKTNQIVVLVILMLAKATLVVMYYMHLRYEASMLRWIALVPFLGGVFYVFIVML